MRTSLAKAALAAGLVLGSVGIGSGTALAPVAPTPTVSVPPEKSPPKIGDHMPDGTVYAGVSPDTRERIYAMPADAPMAMTFKEAVKYARNENTRKAFGHGDWHVPSRSELNVLFNNRAAVGALTRPAIPESYWWIAPGSTLDKVPQIGPIDPALQRRRAVRLLRQEP